MVIHARRSTDNDVLVHATTIQSLPVEILLSIFALAIQWDVEDWKSTWDTTVYRVPKGASLIIACVARVLSRH